MLNLSKYRMIVTACAIVFLLVPGSVQAQPETLWSYEMGDSLCYFTSVATTADSGFILTGPNDDQVWLVRLNSVGDTVWTTDYSFATEVSDFPLVAQVSDGGFILASDGDPWLVKFDANGVKVWEQAQSTIGMDTTTTGGFDGYYIMDMVELADGSLVIAGGYRVGDAYNIFVKTTSTGEISWVKSFGRGTAMSLILDSSGALVSAGLFGDSTGTGWHQGLLKLSTDGDSLALKRYYSQFPDSLDYHLLSIEETADHGYIMAGRAGDDNNVQRYYVVLADSDGELVWEKIYNDNGRFEGETTTITQVGTNFMVCGMAVDTTTGDMVARTLFLSSIGDTVWTSNLGLDGMSVIFDLTEITPGEYLLAGAMIYQFDPSMKANGLLSRITFNGTTSVVSQVLPSKYSLSQNYPNPFNPVTTINYTLPERSEIKLTVFDIQGREIRVLQDGAKPAGRYTVRWDGLDHAGQLVPTGIYLSRMQAGSYTKVVKMLLLK